MRLDAAADVSLPAICDFHETVAAKSEMPDAIVVPVVIVK